MLMYSKRHKKSESKKKISELREMVTDTNLRDSYTETPIVRRDSRKIPNLTPYKPVLHFFPSKLEAL